jgi:phosphatidate cytidylyltransferase
MLKQRVITALILLLLLLAAVFALPASGWAVLVALTVMQGSREWARLAKMGGLAAGLYWMATLIIFLALLWMYFNVASQQKITLQLLIYGAAAVFWIGLVPAWLMGIWKTQNSWLMAVVGWFVLLPTGMAMLDLRFENPQPWWLLGVMGLVWMADISAYFAGRKFGRHKLAPSISPGKTWEGVAGAMVGVTVYVLAVMLGSGMTQRYSLFLFAIAGVALSVIGDLFESAIKRQAGVKDSGALLPGHGGLLDRIDALTSTLPLAALVLILTRFA